MCCSRVARAFTHYLPMHSPGHFRARLHVLASRTCPDGILGSVQLCGCVPGSLFGRRGRSLGRFAGGALCGGACRRHRPLSCGLCRLALRALLRCLLLRRVRTCSELHCKFVKMLGWGYHKVSGMRRNLQEQLPGSRAAPACPCSCLLQPVFRRYRI